MRVAFLRGHTHPTVGRSDTSESPRFDRHLLIRLIGCEGVRMSIEGFKSRWKFAPEFKAEAVKLVEQWEHRPGRRRVGICDSSLGKRVRRARGCGPRNGRVGCAADGISQGKPEGGGPPWGDPGSRQRNPEVCGPRFGLTRPR